MTPNNSVTFDDIALSESEFKSATAVWDYLETLAADSPPERQAWAVAFKLLMRVHKAHSASAADLEVDKLVSREDRWALSALRPDLQRLLSTVWQHGQWKLGELRHWERVWLYLRHLDGVLNGLDTTREVADGAT